MAEGVLLLEAGGDGVVFAGADLCDGPAGCAWAGQACGSGVNLRFAGEVLFIAILRVPRGPEPVRLRLLKDA